jgi:hypothetical protein
VDYDIITVEVIILKTNPYDNQREAVLLAYMAGIIDGEGTIGITKVTPKRYTNPRYTARIHFGNVNKDVVEMFANKFGGSVKEERVPNRKLMYRWYRVGNPITKDIVETLIPYLVIKRPQAENVLEFLNTVKATGYQRRDGVPVEEIQRREYFFQKAKELNATGAPATTNREDTGDGEVIV